LKGDVHDRPINALRRITDKEITIKDEARGTRWIAASLWREISAAKLTEGVGPNTAPVPTLARLAKSTQENKKFLCCTVWDDYSFVAAHGMGLRLSNTCSAPPTIICLVGTSRSGSTLLQSVLAKHSGAVALGEIGRVLELLERGSKCSCGERLAVCTFWAPALKALRRTAPVITWSKASRLQQSDFLRGLLAATTGLNGFASRRERDSARSLENALAILSQVTGRSLFIDSSKEPAEFLRVALLPLHRLIPVHVVRDPRGVVWSAFRRTGVDPMMMAKHWARLNRAIALFSRLTRNYSWQLVRYEDLCRNPQSISLKLFSAAGVAVNSKHSHASHALGGSPGFSVDDRNAIIADERWKAEMPEPLQRRIMLTIGDAARKFGYS
jgi:hypothetical protein